MEARSDSDVRMMERLANNMVASNRPADPDGGFNISRNISHLRLPNFYGRQGEDVSGWLKTCDIAFGTHRIPHHSRIWAVQPFLKDLAGTWYLNKYSEHKAAAKTYAVNGVFKEEATRIFEAMDDPIIVNWYTFQKALRYRFESPNHRQQVLYTLTTLTHERGQITKYISDFSNLEAQLDGVSMW